MAKKKTSNILGTILSLLLIIPASFGIYYGIKYIGGRDIIVPDEKDTKVDVYVDGLKMTSDEYTALLPGVGDYTIVEFKQPGGVDYYAGDIMVIKNHAATQALDVRDNFDSGQYVATKVTLLQKTNLAKIMFSDADYTFQFTLSVMADYTLVTDIDVPDITFHG